MVLIFPEGTRTRDGQIAPFRPGFTALAVRSGAAILPVAIEGAFQAWPRWRKFPGLGRIRVHFGVPILPAEIAGRDERRLLAEVERRVRRCHAQLKGHAHGSRSRAAMPRLAAVEHQRNLVGGHVVAALPVVGLLVRAGRLAVDLDPVVDQVHEPIDGDAGLGVDGLLELLIALRLASATSTIRPRPPPVPADYGTCVVARGLPSHLVRHTIPSSKRLLGEDAPTIGHVLLRSIRDCSAATMCGWFCVILGTIHPSSSSMRFSLVMIPARIISSYVSTPRRQMGRGGISRPL